MAGTRLYVQLARSKLSILPSVFTQTKQQLLVSILYVMTTLTIVTCSAIWGLLDKDDDLRA